MNPQMESEELNAPKPLKKVRLWRGNNMQGFQLNADPSRGPVGAVLPITIDFPTSSRHQATVTITRDTGDGQDTEILSMRDWKGFRPIDEAKSAKPKREWVLFYLDQKLREIEQEMREAKAKPDEIRREQRNWTELVYRVNELGPPPGDMFADQSKRVSKGA